MNRWSVILLVLGLWAASTGLAQQVTDNDQDASGLTAKPAASDVSPALLLKLKSPFITMGTFRRAMKSERPEAMNDAIACLDLTGMGKNAASAKGSTLAFKLNEILNRMFDDYRFLNLSDDPDYETAFQLGNAVLDMPSDDKEDANRITIWRGQNGLWRFSSETVVAIDELYERWRERPSQQIFQLMDADQVEAKKPVSLRIRELFPEALQSTHLWVADYQWICLAVLIFVGFLADFLVRAILHRITVAWFRFIVKSEEMKRAERRMWRPVGLLVQGLIWYTGTRLIELPTTALEVLLISLKFFAIIAGIWTTFRMVDILAGYLKRKASQTSTRFDDLLIPLVSQSLKVICIVVGVVVIAQTYGPGLPGLLGGLGIGGVALALASQDAVSNLFGSLTILADRPFEIGDWIVTEGAEGTVESVGFRSSRIRTFYNSVITLPNSRLTTSLVDNMGRRRYRRIKTTLGLQYDTTPEQIESFCEGVRELIRRHPYTRKDYYQVYLNQFSSSSLDILLYCFVDCSDWSVELRERHRLFLDILRLAKSLGISFAFPTQTLHMFQEQRHESSNGDTEQDPIHAGRIKAAGIAGPLLPPVKRPGSVQFQGPAPIK